MAKAQSPFVWYDLMTPNMPEAKKFYAAVVGWNIRDSGMPGMDYNLLSAGSVDIGGMMPTPPTAASMPPVWNGYIYAEDVDKEAAKAVKLGGSIFQEAMDIPEVGRFAVVGDPSGAAFILFKPNSNESPAEVADNTLGHIGWRELHSGDWKQAWDFYEAMFGWTKGDAMDMGPMGTYQQFKIGDKAMGGMMTKMPDTPRPFWNYYFNVDAIDAAKARIEKAGGKVLMGPHQVPTGQWIINAFDPQGAFFSVLSTGR